MLLFIAFVCALDGDGGAAAVFIALHWFWQAR
jgi:hypothetical protein